ncbi:MAG: hypothetical protein HY901_31640 [Deltaproteobacteria bacterium]|nr:hypothetical protein [Deltaproteobacteria bacterium]
MANSLSAGQMRLLFTSVFRPTQEDRVVALLVDLPNAAVPDNDLWRERRAIAWEWKQTLEGLREQMNLSEIRLCAYENVGSNNNELPDRFFLLEADPSGLDASALATTGRSIERDALLSSSQILLAPTEFSTTAPLKLLAKQLRFRAATLPGFSRAMIPALGLDYERVHARVQAISQRLDQAEGAVLEFVSGLTKYRLELDLRLRLAHASSGLIREMHAAGNLPSGEAYIVPNEGEKEPSRSKGELPVQFGEEVVVFKIEGNRAIEARPHSWARQVEAERQAKALAEEPAYGNIAELGFGVLGEFGVQACGATLLDEKLGLHVAFGRSDHFGGITSPQSFKDPKRVIHIDWVYVPSVQPAISVASARLIFPGGHEEEIIQQDRYVI